jgi:hypothetical protein
MIPLFKIKVNKKAPSKRGLVVALKSRLNKDWNWLSV